MSHHMLVQRGGLVGIEEGISRTVSCDTYGATRATLSLVSLSL